MNFKIIIVSIFLFSVNSVCAQVPLSTPVRIDTVSIKIGTPAPGFDYLKPVFKLQGEQLNNKQRFLRFSALSGYREGVEPIRGSYNSNFKKHIDQERGTHQVMMYNLSIEEMFTHGMINPAYLVLEVKDPSKYRYDPSYGPKTEWLRKNGYCFEVLFPIGIIDGVKIVEDELARILNVSWKSEKRIVKTLVLVRTSAEEKFKSKGEKQVVDIAKGVYNNVPISTLLNSFYSIMPSFDETGYEGMVDVNLGIDVRSATDLPALRKALQRYELDIKEEMRELQMYILTELKKYQ